MAAEAKSETSKLPHWSRAFIRFFLSSLVVLSIPLLTALYAYRTALEVTRKNVNDMQVSLLRQVSVAAERRALEVQDLLNRLVLNPKLLEASLVGYFGEGSPDTFLLYELVQAFRATLFDRSLVVDFYIRLDRNDTLVTATSAITRTYLLDTVGFRHEGAGLAELLAGLDGAHSYEYRPAGPALYAGQARDLMLCLHSFPLDLERRGVIVLVLDPDVLAGNSGKVLDPGTTFQLYDREGRLMYGRGPSAMVSARLSALAPLLPAEGYERITVNREELLVTCSTVQSVEWKCVVGTPMGSILGPVVRIRNTLVALSVLAAAAALALAYLLATRNVRPITSLVRLFTGVPSPAARKDTSNEFAYLEGSIAGLISSERSTQEALKAQTGKLRDTLFERLFEGLLTDAEHLRALQSHTAVALEGKLFLVMTIHVNEYDTAPSAESLGRLDFRRMAIQGAVASRMAAHVEHVRVAHERRLSVLLSWTSDEASFRRYADESARELVSSLSSRGIDVVIGLGGVSADALGIAASSDRSLRALDHYLNKQSLDPVVWCAETSGELACYAYSARTEQMLTNIVRTGNRDELEPMLQAIQRENFTERRLSSRLYRHLLFDLRNTLIKVLDHVDIEGREEYLARLCAMPPQEPESEMRAVAEIYRCVCASIGAGRRDRHLALKERLSGFLQANYHQSTLCLNNLVAPFGYSEHYLYNVFRELFGSSFAEYLEELRLERACEQLRDPSVPVKEIAYRVGYSSDASFRRAFKRRHGVNPTEYRDVSRDAAAARPRG